MASKNCMNEACRGTTTSEWKKGWSLKSGGFATLCYSCGSAYENSLFCETFHSEDSGWRECRICGKRIHCGCIASRYLHEYLDFGGVGCISCAKRLEIHAVQSIQIPGDTPNGTFATNGIRDVHPVVENQIDDDKFSTERLLQLTKAIGSNDVSSALEQLKPEESMFKTRQSSKRLLNLAQQCSSSALFKTDSSRPKEGVKDIYESLPQPSLNFSLTTPLGSPSSGLPFPGAIVEGSEQSKGSFQQGQRTRHVLPKPPKPSPTAVSETSKGTSSQTRVARPPAEGRGRNQLLPRYWPKITDQELQQLSGDLKSTIVPLFEKILSASDAGRIGRLVLPKACAEEAQTPSIVNGDSPGETSFSGVTDNPLSNGGRTSDDSLQRHMPISEKKKARNIKNKRLLMPSDDAMELRITWEEAQELLRPSPTAEPNVVMVEDHEFEEFEEPPIFGKRTIFTSRPSESRSNWLNVIVAQNGGGCLCMLFFLQSGHVQRIYGTQKVKFQNQFPCSRSSSIN
ncbi:UNVERIFIED_CONTAM: B3 domain-containing transcription repressor VAL1 [Sesamum calycinum]|uniref:B3 domain-containing transcription repressor VAL1 n=1 Tax=Sesamum calycinum TaxID=2727403 RepID=A0AAW2S9U0_9LAMI